MKYYLIHISFSLLFILCDSSYGNTLSGTVKYDGKPMPKIAKTQLKMNADPVSRRWLFKPDMIGFCVPTPWITRSRHVNAFAEEEHPNYLKVWNFGRIQWRLSPVFRAFETESFQ